jgi:hypothetical protein
MRVDLAFDYFAGSQGICRLAWYELNTVIAVSALLLAYVLVLHD